MTTTTNTDSIIIALTEDEIAAICGRSGYKEATLLCGDVAGHLSGAALKGAAKKWASKYAEARAALRRDVFAAHGVTAAPIAPRRGVVWAKEVDGEMVPVEFVRG